MGPGIQVRMNEWRLLHRAKGDWNNVTDKGKLKHESFSNLVKYKNNEMLGYNDVIQNGKNFSVTNLRRIKKTTRSQGFIRVHDS